MITHEQKADVLLKLKSQFDTVGPISIDDQGKVTVQGDVQNLGRMKQILVEFDHVLGNFRVDRCGLKTLKGMPREVGGNVSIARNPLMSLEHSPRKVGGHFWAYGCLYHTLQGGPHTVLGNYSVHDTQLINYDHMPHGCSQVTMPYDPHIGVLKLLAYPKITILAEGPHREKMQAEHITFILNDPRWVGKGKKGMLNCALELKRAGFESNAKW